MCGVAGEPLGVDAEQIRPLRERVLRRVFAPEEVAAVGESASPDEMFFRFWTLKESFVKAIGIGISYPMQEVRFQLTPQASVPASRTGSSGSISSRDSG